MKRFFPVLTTIALLASGCTHLEGQTDTESVSTETDYAPHVVRYGRYTMVEVGATTEQADLLSQIIDTRIPTVNPTVKDAMTHVTRMTGFSLCEAESASLGTLYSRPLPAPHYRLGPMSLRDALQVLAGPAFELQVDPVYRTVCFHLKPSLQPEAVTADSTVVPVPTPTPETQEIP